MTFIVQFLDVAQLPMPSVLRTAEFDDRDFGAVVERIRIILSCRTFEPKADAFRVLEPDGAILHYERRDDC